jgi:hypothetical protein
MILSSAASPASDLVGRAAETERVDALLDHLRQGGAALVIRGDPGIGKSALLQHAGERAGDLGAAVLTTIGTESEAELAFAGLYELLRPVINRMGSLPEPQRRSLEAAFGLAAEVEPDPFRVALAAYKLVCDAADITPLFVVVDDAHWLDRSSLAVLTFIARRLGSEPVALAVAVRRGYVTLLDDARLPLLELGPLDAAVSVEILERHAPDLTPMARDHVLEQAAGNPLALVELARARPGPERLRDRLAPAPATLTARLEDASAARLGDLPGPTRLVLLAAALDAGAPIEELLACATLLHGTAVTVRSVDLAVAVGLVDLVEGEIRFRHPLVRSAVQQAALPPQTIAAHRALADVVADPERQLWHRASAAVGTDDAVADGLDAHARAARGPALERAATLTADPYVKGLPYPTLAVAHGQCVAGGFELALFCDLLWCAEGTLVGLPGRASASCPWPAASNGRPSAPGSAGRARWPSRAPFTAPRSSSPGAWSTVSCRLVSCSPRRTDSPRGSPPGRPRRWRRSSAYCGPTARGASGRPTGCWPRRSRGCSPPRTRGPESRPTCAGTWPGSRSPGREGVAMLDFGAG